jgi:GH25 family lysozyme M1 (1,4-beta-N-acetylmuramidase)
MPSRILRPLTYLPVLAMLFALLVLVGPAPARAAFPGDNGDIAFRTNRNGPVQIFTMNRDGSSEKKLTGVNDDANEPAWSPDGTGMVFSSCCPQGTTQREIYAINANGSGTTRITDNNSKDWLPVWSPDGTKIAFVSTRDGNREIYVMNADGTGQTNLTKNSAADSAPAWSPDGDQIAFASKRDVGNYEVWLMNADGTGLDKLTNRPATDTEPDWSPDGKTIAFQSDRSGNNDVFIIGADGVGVKNLTSNPNSDARPAWSPDGNKIAFDSNRSGNYDIWKMDTDGSSPKQLTTSTAKDQRPDWQPLATPLFEGLDVSHWQGAIDFDAVAASGIRFIFAKASEGQTFVDEMYETNRADAGAAGLAFGAYHYAKPDSSTDDAVKEADHFVDTALPSSGDLLPVIDLETSGGLSNTKLIAWLWDFLDQVLARTGVHALIYTSPSFWGDHMNDTDEFADGGYDLLWIAHWFAPTPTVPGNNWGGNGWTFWQNDDCFDVPGIDGCVDHDYYNGIILTPAEVP